MCRDEHCVVQEMQRLKAAWVVSRPKDYLAELSASRTSRRQSPQRLSSARPTTEASHGEEVLQLETERASRTDYNRWVSSDSDPKALTWKLDDENRAVSTSSALADLEEVGYGYGDDFTMTLHGRERAKAVIYRGGKRGTTPERMRRMARGLHADEPDEHATEIADQTSQHIVGDQADSHDLQAHLEQGNADEPSRMHLTGKSQVSASTIEDGESAADYRAELQTVLPSSQKAEDESHREPSILEMDKHSPPVPGETEFEVQLRCASVLSQYTSCSFGAKIAFFSRLPGMVLVHF